MFADGLRCAEILHRQRSKGIHGTFFPNIMKCDDGVHFDLHVQVICYLKEDPSDVVVERCLKDLVKDYCRNYFAVSRGEHGRGKFKVALGLSQGSSSSARRLWQSRPCRARPGEKFRWCNFAPVCLRREPPAHRMCARCQSPDAQNSRRRREQ